METIEKQMIYEEYTSKKPFTALIMIGATVAWLLAILGIAYIVNAVVVYTINLF